MKVNRAGYRMSKGITIGLLAVCLTGIACAEDKYASEIAVVKKRLEDDRVWFVPATSQAPVIDGRIEDIWKKSKAHRFTWLNDKAPPKEGRPEWPQDRTDVYMLCDKENFYVAFECQADVAKLRGSNPPLERDQVEFKNDYVEIIMDPTHSRREGFQFVIECYGTFSDVIYNQKYAKPGNNWGEEIPWTSKGVEWKTSVGEKAYYVEAKIPFRTLVLDPAQDKPAGKVNRIWGVSLNRLSQRTKEDTAIGFTGRVASARPAGFGRAIIEVGE